MVHPSHSSDTSGSLGLILVKRNPDVCTKIHTLNQRFTGGAVRGRWHDTALNISERTGSNNWGEGEPTIWENILIHCPFLGISCQVLIASCLWCLLLRCFLKRHEVALSPWLNPPPPQQMSHALARHEISKDKPPRGYTTLH